MCCRAGKCTVGGFLSKMETRLGHARQLICMHFGKKGKTEAGRVQKGAVAR